MPVINPLQAFVHPQTQKNYPLGLSKLQKSEFAVLVLGFEKLGLELDNCGRTTKNAYCRIYSL